MIKIHGKWREIPEDWEKLDKKVVLPSKINLDAIVDKMILDEEILLRQLKRDLGSHLFNRWLKYSCVKGVVARSRSLNIIIDD